MQRLIVSLLLVAPIHGQEQVSFSSSAPPAPSSVGASAFGARGGATLYYWVIARYPGGASSASMAMAFSTVGIGNLSVSNYVRVSWAPVAGATGYDVVRSESPLFPGPTCAACAVVLNTASTSVDDNGGAMSAYPPGGLQTAVPVLASITINNRDGAVPFVNLQLLSIRMNEVLRVGLISGTPAEDDCLKYAGGRITSAGAACGGSGGGGTALTAAATSGGDRRIYVSSGDSRAMVGTGCTIDAMDGLVCPTVSATGNGVDPGELPLYESPSVGGDYISFLAPSSIPNSYRLQMPSGQPSSGGRMLSFADPVMGIAAGSWVNGGSGAQWHHVRGAACQDTVGGAGFSYPSTNKPTAVCDSGTNTLFGVLQFTEASTQSVQTWFQLPDSFTSAEIEFYWRTSATSGDVAWQVQTACLATSEALGNGGSGGPSWNTTQEITSTADGTAYDPVRIALTSLTTTGCAANEILLLRLSRDPTDAQDTIAATAELISMSVKVTP